MFVNNIFMFSNTLYKQEDGRYYKSVIWIDFIAGIRYRVGIYNRNDLSKLYQPMVF